MEGTGLYPYHINNIEETMRKKQSAISNQPSVNSNQPSAISYQQSNAGFTLVELLITMVVFVLAIAAASQIFTGLLTQFKQQSKIAETNIEGIVGLEILRQDLEHAGYGLPWVIPSGVTYSEAASSTICGTANPSTYNDSTANPPKAIVSGNNNCTNNSDYLVIKAVNVATNDASKKSTRLISTSPYVRTWDPTSENPASTDRVIVIYSGTGTNERGLIANGSTFYTTYGVDGANVKLSPWPPPLKDPARIVYGVDADTNLRMPFNRADYYIRPLTTGELPRCAPGTGVLTKTVISQANGGTTNALPLLDCVADMQVTYCLDANGDGTPEKNSDDISASGLNLNAQQIREQVKEVRVYIVAHEGQRDATYDFSIGGTRTPSPKYLSLPLEVCGTASRSINFVDLDALIGGAEYKYYRWKLYTIVVKPMDLYK